MNEAAAPERIPAECPSCHARLRVPATAAGKKVRCPKCRNPFAVEAPEPEIRILEEPPPPPAADLVAVVKSEPAESRSFLAGLAGAFLYPISNLSGILFLLIMAPLWALATSFLGRIFFIVSQIVIGGYIAAYMWQILYDTSMDKKGGPTFPDPTDFSELAGNYFRFFFAWVIAFLPVIALLVVAWIVDAPLLANPAYKVAVWATAAFGVFYYPMTVMIIGFADSIWAPLNYVFTIKSILRIPGSYLVCAVFFVVSLVGAVILAALLISSLPGEGLLLVIAAEIVAAAVILYLYAVQMRALGVLYVCNKEKLGWFR